MPEERFAEGRHVGALVPLFSIPSRVSWGIGEIPDAVLLHLGGKHDLGIHTEMIGDGILKLSKGTANGKFSLISAPDATETREHQPSEP